MDFNFRLSRPLVLPSYEMAKDDLLDYDQGREAEQLRENEQVPTYINMSISLEPAIGLPDENEGSYYPGHEDPKLLQYCSKWCNELRKQKKMKGPLQCKIVPKPQPAPSIASFMSTSDESSLLEEHCSFWLLPR